jgi:separase
MMDNGSIDSGFAGYIQSHSIHPLGISKKINFTPQNNKAIESRAHQQILKMVAETLGGKNDLEMISNSFKCLYLVPGTEASISVIKKHHILVIKLIEAKLYREGLVELQALQQYLRYIVNGKNVSFEAMSLKELVGGISFPVELKSPKKKESLENSDSNSTNSTTISGLPSAITSQLVTLIITFHFLVLQCMLQYISSNLRSVATNKNELNHSTFRDISNLFLHNSNFLKWLQLSKAQNSSHIHNNPDLIHQNSLVKYQNNIIKMINGYTKVLDILIKNLKSHKLKVYRSCFLLKLVEFKGEALSSVNIETIVVDNELVPFINDLEESNIDITAIVERIQPSSTLEIEKNLHSFVLKPTTDALHILQLKLTRVDGDILLNAHVMEMLQLSPNENNETFLPLISIMVSHFVTSTQSMATLTRNHLIILDSFTRTLKNVIEIKKESETIIAILQQLYTIFSNFKQLKRVRNLSNLLYNLGNKVKSVNSWTFSIDYESFIYNEEPKEENFAQLELKSQKIVNSLLGLGYIQEASLILGDLVQVFEVHREGPYLTTTENPLLVHLVVKCISMKKDIAGRFFGENNLSDSFKTALVISVFEFLEKLTNADEKTMVASGVMNSLSISDRNLKLIIIYHYYEISSLNNRIDIKADEFQSNDSALLLSGVFLQQLINFKFNEDLLRRVIQLFETWVSQNNHPFEEYEIKIFTLLIRFLKFNGLSGQIILLINRYKSNYLSGTDTSINSPTISNTKFQFLLENELYMSLLKLSLQKVSSDTLVNINTMLKQFKITSIHEIINFNLHQFEYCVLIKNNIMAKEKFGKILKVLKSRSEFNLNGNSQLKLIDKFNNLMLVARFQFITSKFNLSLGNHLEAVRNIKISIKLLYSIVKKCGNITRSNYNRLKWETTHLLFDSYRQILTILKHLGLSRDFLYFLNEFEKLNLSSLIPLINCLNHFDLIVYNFYIQSEDIETSFEKVDELLRYELVTENLNVSDDLKKVLILRQGKQIGLDSEKINGFMERRVEMIENMKENDEMIEIMEENDEMLEIPKENDQAEKCSNKRIKTNYSNRDQMGLINADSYTGNSVSEALGNLKVDQISPKILKNLSHSSSFDWNYIFSMISNISIQEVNSLSTKLISSKVKIFQTISELGQTLNYRMMADTVRALPCIVNEGYIDKNMLNLSIINSLIECKEALLSFLTTASLTSITHYQLRDLNCLLGKCLSLISSMTIFKLQTTLLFDLYYLQDMANSIPFKNDRLINHSSTKPDDLLPLEIVSDRALEQFEALSINFNLDLNLHLPDNWSVINLDVCSSGDLILTKFLKGKQPFFMRIPSKGDFDQSDTFLKFKDTFQDIIHQSDLSTKSITTSKITTKEDRKRWWKLRFSLDLKLKELLNEVQQWFGGFKSIFNNFNEDSVYCKFKLDLIKVINTSLPSRKGSANSFMEFDENIIKSFYALPSYEKSSVDHLLYFIIDSLSFHGEQNRYEEIKFDKFHKSIEILFDKYFNLRSRFSNEHMVLIPSSKCAFFPWESMDCLENKSISRVPSVDLLIELLKSKKSNFSIKNKANTFYMINPGGDLVRTEEKFKAKFQQNLDWNGWVGQQPGEDRFLESLLATDLFVYLGHGGCDQYLKTSTLFKKCLPNGPKLPPSLLIGCSSGALKDNGFLEASGNIYNWLTCGSPMTLVNLWDVTDKDIDHFSLSVFEKWSLLGTGKKNLSICDAVVQSRSCCTLKYLNGAAPVVYGLPLYLE